MTVDSSGVVKFPNLTPGTQYTLDAYTMSGVQTSESLTKVLYTSKFGVQNLLRSHAYMYLMGGRERERERERERG